ncbi:MAG: hypothetical protein ACKVWR_12445 [Acidimicrobiales bacterium]
MTLIVGRTDRAPDAAPGAPHGFALVDGVELVGEFQGSAFTEQTFIARRPDGRAVQLSPLLFALARLVDRQPSLAELADAASASCGREVAAADAELLLREKLAKVGLVERADEAEREAPPATPAPEERSLLGLHLRMGAVPDRLVQAGARRAAPLFRPLVMALVVAGAVAAEASLLLSDLRAVLADLLVSPGQVLVLYAVIAASVLFHEFGHAGACRYGGARPGKVGFGLYLTWPVFYSNVTDSYRLSRAGRLRVDLGGIYFNAVLLCVFAGGYQVTGEGMFVAFGLAQNMIVVQQLLPFLRLDGYWVVSDLAGVPDLYRYLGPTFSSLRRRPGLHPALARLAPRPRLAVRVWALAAAPALVVQFGGGLVFVPRAVEFAAQGLAARWAAMDAFLGGDGSAAMAAVALVEIVIVVLPSLGLIPFFVLAGRRLVKQVWSWERSVAWRAAALGGLTVTVCTLISIGALL